MLSNAILSDKGIVQLIPLLCTLVLSPSQSLLMQMVTAAAQSCGRHLPEAALCAQGHLKGLAHGLA